MYACHMDIRLDLTPDQKNAARQLGYSKASWDKVDSPKRERLSPGSNERYVKFRDMLSRGMPESLVARKMEIAGFTRPEVKSFLAGDSIGPNAVPAPGSFSNLKEGSPVKGLKNIPTVLKTSLTSAMAAGELRKSPETKSQSRSSQFKAQRSQQDRVTLKNSYGVTVDDDFKTMMDNASTFQEKRNIMDKQIKANAKEKAKLQRKLQKKLEESGGPSTKKYIRKRFSPKRDLEKRAMDAKKADKQLSVTERELVKERAVLDEKMEELLSIRKQVGDIDKKVKGTRVTTKKLLELMEQLFQVIIQKQDGKAFSPEATASLRGAVLDPINHFYKRNQDVRGYIDQKLKNMSSIIPLWPEPKEDATPSPYTTLAPSSGGDSQALVTSDFSRWSEKELNAVLNSTKGHIDSVGEGQVETVIGIYRLHIVSEPPVKAHKFTRTVNIETDDGEFYMLGKYHHYDGIRTEEEIKQFNNKVVKVVGIKYDFTPPDKDNKNDVLSKITPYIGSIRSIELV